MELPPYINSLKGELEWEGHKIKAAVELMQPSSSLPKPLTRSCAHGSRKSEWAEVERKSVFCESESIGGPIVIELEWNRSRNFVVYRKS